METGKEIVIMASWKVSKILSDKKNQSNKLVPLLSYCFFQSELLDFPKLFEKRFFKGYAQISLSMGLCTKASILKQVFCSNWYESCSKWRNLLSRRKRRIRQEILLSVSPSRHRRRKWASQGKTPRYARFLLRVCNRCCKLLHIAASIDDLKKSELVTYQIWKWYILIKWCGYL